MKIFFFFDKPQDKRRKNFYNLSKEERSKLCSVIVECKPTRHVLEQIKECVAFRDNFSEEYRRVNEIELDEFIYDEIFRCADKIIKMMVKKAYEEGYKMFLTNFLVKLKKDFLSFMIKKQIKINKFGIFQ